MVVTILITRIAKDALQKAIDEHDTNKEDDEEVAVEEGAVGPYRTMESDGGGAGGKGQDHRNILKVTGDRMAGQIVDATSAG